MTKNINNTVKSTTETTNTNRTNKNNKKETTMTTETITATTTTPTATKCATRKPAAKSTKKTIKAKGEANTTVKTPKAPRVNKLIKFSCTKCDKTILYHINDLDARVAKSGKTMEQFLETFMCKVCKRDGYKNVATPTDVTTQPVKVAVAKKIAKTVKANVAKTEPVVDVTEAAEAVASILA